MTNLVYLILLILSTLLILFVSNYIRKSKNKNQLTSIYSVNFLLIIVWNVSLILQILFSDLLKIPPVSFDHIAYIGICFLPVSLFFTSQIFINTKIRFKKAHLLLFIIPVISLIILWTNPIHNLFYIKYSFSFVDTLNGPYFYIHTIYSYSLIIWSLLSLSLYSVKNSGFFSKQSLLIFTGVLIPLIINGLATFKILNLSIYVTPISFAFAIFFIALAIFKFDFLKVTPIALQRVVDRMSDSYLVINEDNKISDFNHTFLDVFKVTENKVRNRDLFELLAEYKDLNINTEILANALETVRTSNVTVSIEEHFGRINKYFHVEINSIKSKGNFLGSLILLKDITQHTEDMQTIRNNQDMLIEKERLASLGQMIGGIAHNLKTPIMSISGAAEGLSDLIKEYDMSIGDPGVTEQDNHDIAKDMTEWIAKIRTHLSYMSDIITAIKGQAVAFGDQTSTEFTINELLKMVNILMKHELKNAIINLNTKADIDISTIVKGNINSLVQVVNNIISNAIQAYQAQGRNNENIDFTIYKEKQKLILKIQDYAGGLPEKVQESLFKEMITTKGKNGSGLGLFMSYSNIKAHFSGHMRYETKKGEGTIFYIEIPL